MAVGRSVGDYRPARLEDLPLFAPSPEQRKAEGMAKAYDNSADWRLDAEPALRDILLGYRDGDELTTDALTPKLPELTPEQRAKWVGSLIGKAANSWEWLSWTGRYKTSRRDSLAGSPLKVWKVNREAVARGIPETKRKAA